ncbi:MAG TPA: pitrilysin family protein [Usitatibacteraceae bacterium]
MLACAMLISGSFAVTAWAADTARAAPVKHIAKVVPIGASKAAAIGASIDKVTSVEGITEYRLSNGLRVLLFPDQSKPTITVNVTYLVGSRQENYGETGMAHLLEHLMFKGTPRFPKIDEGFNARGMRSNGSTWLDRTNYFELFEASEDNLKWALSMEADRMVHSNIARKDLDSEMTVVRNEYENGENAPFSVMLKRMQSVSFDWHNYGHSTIGNRSDIENVRIENLQAFYRTYYQPDNAVLLVAGKFDEAKVLEWIRADFGVIPKPVRVLPKFWTVEPPQDGERQFYVRRKGDIQLVAIGYKVPSGLHADSTPLGFANAVLTNTPAGRLHKALVETGKAAQVFGFPLEGVDSGLHIIGAVVKKGEPLEPVRDEIARIVEDFYKNPPSAEEMERVRVASARSYEEALNNHENIGVQMSEYIALGDWRLFFYSRDSEAGVTSEQVTKAAQAYYRRDNRVVGFFVPEDAPQRAEITAPPPVAELLKDFKPKAAGAQAEAFDPSNVNIDQRTRRLEIGGLKIALLQKKNRGETVNLSLRFHSGDEKSLFGKSVAQGFAAAMLTRGSSKMTRTQIADAFDQLKVSGGVNGLGASMQTTKPNLAAAIRLAAQVMREPSFPETEFEQLRAQSVTGLEAQRSDPNAIARSALAKHFNIWPKGDPRYAADIDESIVDIKAVTLAEVKQFHHDFYGANRGELAIVGDFDEAEVLKAVSEAFAGWQSAMPYKRLEGSYRDVPPLNRVIETPDKENGYFGARLNINMNEDDPDYPAMVMMNYMMGGGAGLNARLAERIRQKDGLSYGVDSALNIDAIDRDGAWSVRAIAAPQNIAKVEAAFREEVARALKEGFSDKELAAAKSGYLQQRLQARAQDGSVASRWLSYLYYGQTFARSQAFEDRIMALKPDDVVSAMRKHIDPAKISIVKAGDFAKVAKSAATAAPAAR